MSGSNTEKSAAGGRGGSAGEAAGGGGSSFELERRRAGSPAQLEVVKAGRLVKAVGEAGSARSLDASASDRGMIELELGAGLGGRGTESAAWFATARCPVVGDAESSLSVKVVLEERVGCRGELARGVNVSELANSLIASSARSPSSRTSSSEEVRRDCTAIGVVDLEGPSL